MKNLSTTATFLDTKPHYDLLDGLRGVAALLVVVYHVFEGFSFAELTNGAGDGLIRTFNHGYLAVDFFFMLSGFVISYAYDDRFRSMSLGSFFKRRLIRLHPMLLIGVLIGVATFVAQGRVTWSGETIGWEWIALSALLTGLSVYDDIAKFAGAGTLVPITGFANAISAPAIEFKTEGFVLGLAAKMFTIAGPVIVYGLGAGVVYGIVYWIVSLV